MLRALKLFTREVCEMFVYKHAETIEYIKKLPAFKKNKNFTGA